MNQFLYFSTIGSKIYSLNLTGKNNAGRTCLVAMTTRRGAESLGKKVIESATKRPIVKKVDFGANDDFYKMMRLNNFCLLVAESFICNDEEILFDGNLVEVEYVPSDEHRVYFEKLYKDS
jgi:hypothetical protein